MPAAGNRRGAAPSPARRAGATRSLRQSDVRLLYVEQFDVEDQRRVRRNHAARTARTVAKLRWNHERALAAHLHAGHALVPPLDHAAGAERKAERRAAIARTVELGAVRIGLRRIVEPTRVVHYNRMAWRGFGALAVLDIDLLQIFWCGIQLALSFRSRGRRTDRRRHVSKRERDHHRDRDVRERATRRRREGTNVEGHARTSVGERAGTKRRATCRNAASPHFIRPAGRLRIARSLHEDMPMIRRSMNAWRRTRCIAPP